MKKFIPGKNITSFPGTGKFPGNNIVVDFQIDTGRKGYVRWYFWLSDVVLIKHMVSMRNITIYFAYLAKDDKINIKVA